MVTRGDLYGEVRLLADVAGYPAGTGAVLVDLNSARAIVEIVGDAPDVFFVAPDHLEPVQSASSAA